MLKRKFITFLFILFILAASAIYAGAAYDEDVMSEVTEGYSDALSLAGRYSFHGNCNLATAYQLQVRGIYSGDLDFAGSGEEWYTYFKETPVTSGGYNVITISGKNCLYDLIEKYGNPVYDIVYALGTGGSSGSRHVLYIRAIINGYVYFADSFGCTYGSTYYPEGACTVLSLEKFVSAYKGMNGDAYGCIYFTKDLEPENLEGSEQDPDSWENDNKEYTEGNYIVTASSLNLRSEASADSESLELIPNGETVTVDEISGDWGKTTYNNLTGWISLEYTLKTAGNNDNDTGKGLLATSLTANKSSIIPGETITWTASVDGEGDKFYYSFDIYFDGDLLYSGEYQSAANFSYTANAFGEYQASVTVTDTKNNKAQIYGDSAICRLQAAIEIGDVDGNGKITSSDARIALRAASQLDSLNDEAFLRADIDKNGKITSADARKILRKAANLE